jgi:ATPase subunit of ABC transporter with duplicated ATPase domains
LQKIINRLSRPSLNIGVVGRMGQGKSTFLKSLSGLTDNEIPAREGGACTAVRSKISHHDGELKTRITIHSKSSFFRRSNRGIL